MTQSLGLGAVVPFWPVWTRTLDDMIHKLARGRSRCRMCRTLLRVDLDALRGRLGGSASLINRSDACPIVGCGGKVYYLGTPATGTAYHVLVGDPALLDGVVDPVGTPFRSRWHGRTAVGTAPTLSPVGAEVIIWPGAAR